MLVIVPSIGERVVHFFWWKNVLFTLNLFCSSTYIGFTCGALVFKIRLGAVLRQFDLCRNASSIYLL